MYAVEMVGGRKVYFASLTSTTITTGSRLRASTKQFLVLLLFLCSFRYAEDTLKVQESTNQIGPESGSIHFGSRTVHLSVPFFPGHLPLSIRGNPYNHTIGYACAKLDASDALMRAQSRLILGVKTVGVGYG